MLQFRVMGRPLVSLLLIVVMAAAAVARDDDDDDGDGRRERSHHRQDQMREAVERGDIKPLAEVLRIVQPKLRGEIAGVEIEYKSGRWIYEFRVLDRNGSILDVHVDAATAEIIDIEEK